MNSQEQEPQGLERRINLFIVKATPKIFEWFGWIAALGATQFVYAKTKSQIVYALLLFGYLTLFLYAHALLITQLKFSRIKNAHNRELVSGITSLLLAFATFKIAQDVITAFSLSAR